MTGIVVHQDCPICGARMALLTQTKEIEGRPTLRRSGIFECQMPSCGGEWQMTVMLEPTQQRTVARWSMALRNLRAGA